MSASLDGHQSAEAVTWTRGERREVSPLPAVTSHRACTGGTGTYQFNELAILARSGGKCTMKKPPTSAQVLIKATASVKL